MHIPKIGEDRFITIRARSWTGQILNNKDTLFDEHTDGNNFYLIHENLDIARRYAKEEIIEGLAEVIIYDDCGTYIETHRPQAPKAPVLEHPIKTYFHQLLERLREKFS